MRDLTIGVTLVLSITACSSSGGAPAPRPGSAATTAHAPAPPKPVEPRIPPGPVPLSLPHAPDGFARRVAQAQAFVTQTEPGAIAFGPLVAGAAPYSGKPVPDGHTLDQAIGAALGVAAPPPPPPPPPSLAQQQALGAARSAGILGSTALGGAFAMRTGGSIKAVLEPTGTIDVLILADAMASAITLHDTLGELEQRRAGLAVIGQGAPDAIVFRFDGLVDPDAPPPAVTLSVMIEDSAHGVQVQVDGEQDTVPFTGGAVDRDGIVATLARLTTHPPSEIGVIADDRTTVQQLIDVLAAARSAGATQVAFGSAGLRMIGTGGPGTGGHGSVPSVSIGAPDPGAGNLDKAVIRRYIKRSLAKITYCYEKELLAKPSLAGKVTAHFTIGDSGKVTSSTAAGLDADVARCVAAVIHDIEFPTPSGGSVDVNYPFVFKAAP